jgi:hypothetical protein
MMDYREKEDDQVKQETQVLFEMDHQGKKVQGVILVHQAGQVKWENQDLLDFREGQDYRGCQDQEDLLDLQGLQGLQVELEQLEWLVLQDVQV